MFDVTLGISLKCFESYTNVGYTEFLEEQQQWKHSALFMLASSHLMNTVKCDDLGAT